MITKEQLNKLKPGDCIEEVSTNSLCEFTGIENDVFLFKTIYSLTYTTNIRWGLINIDLFNEKNIFSKCSKKRIEYYKKLMVFS